MTPRLLIYTPHRSPRLEYTLQWVLEERLGIMYEISTEPGARDTTSVPFICYDNTGTVQGIHIIPSGLLAETGIQEQKLTPAEWHGLPVFFSNAGTVIPFDIFSAVFYLIARYEEYVYPDTDAHGRFLHTRSILHACNALQLPLVDLWIQRLGEILKEHFPDLALKKETFQYQPTFDIDQAFAFQEKGWWRNGGGLLRELSRFDFGMARLRLQVVCRQKKDPFDTFDSLLAWQQEFGFEALAFVLLADYGKHDKNIPYSNPAFQQRIRMLQEKLPVGIHPSYDTCNDALRLKKELHRLVEILARPVSLSRQHYLRFNLPLTYEILLDAGIRHEYSMGYSPVTGFRAGTSHSFLWYHLVKETVTSLRVHPVCAMDVTLKNQMQLTPGKATETLITLLEQVRAVNGNFICIWHNESISEFGEWSGWSDVFKTLTRKALSLQA